MVWECGKTDFILNVTNPSNVQAPSKLIDYGITNRPVLHIDNNYNNCAVFLKFYEGDYTSDHKIDFLDNYHIEKVHNYS